MENAMNQPVKAAGMRRLAVEVAVVFAAFLIGFAPMWLVARTRANELDAVQQSLRLAQIENAVALAAIQARRGEYEPAREATSTFYTNLRAELDRSQPVFSPAQRELLQPLLERRDPLITLLARADHAAVDQLAELYISYRQVGAASAMPAVR